MSDGSYTTYICWPRLDSSRTSRAGRDRRAFSAPEREARQLFASLAEDAGLEVRTDAAGMSPRAWSPQRPARQTLLAGSHMDTVPNGGPYDGALGVIAALESLRVLKESGQTLPVTLECIAFTDEEGRYAGLTGSQLAAACTAVMLRSSSTTQ